MTGSGTAQDPYILTTWQELLNASGVCEWHGGDLDFNDIQPTGFTQCVVIYATSINFRGATFKNFYSRATGTAPFSGGIRFSCNISNLRFINSAFVNVRSPQIGVISEYSSVSATSCVFDGEVISTNRDIVIVGSSSNSSYYYSTSYNKCSFNFKTKSAHQVWFASGIAAFYNCDIYVDMEQNGNEFTDVYHGGYNGRFDCCHIQGRFIDINGNSVKVGQNNTRYVYNFYDFDEGNYILFSSESKSIYDSGKITAQEGTTNVVACTAEQLASVSYLRSSNVGWEINENATPSQTLNFGVDDLHNATSKRIETMPMDYTGIIKMRALIKGYASSDWYWFRFSGRNINGNEIYNSGWRGTGTTIQIPFNDNVVTWVLQSANARLSYGNLDFYDATPEDVAPISCTIAWGNWSINSNGRPYNIYAPTNTELGAFANAVSLMQISIPRSCKKIGRYAFRNTHLSSVTIARDCVYYNTSFPEGCVVHYYPD